MITIWNHPTSIMVLFAISLHLFWALFIWIDPAAVDATPLHALYLYVQPPRLLAFVVAACALLALVGIYSRVLWVAVLLLPQQILLMGSASGAVEVIWLGHLLDGVSRPRAYLATVEIYSVLALVGHTIAIIVHTKRLMEENGYGNG